MKADIYRTNQRNTLLLLPEGGQLSSVPQSVLDQFGTPRFWKNVELAPNIIAVKPAAVEADFKKQGYSVQRYEIKVTTKTGKNEK